MLKKERPRKPAQDYGNEGDHHSVAVPIPRIVKAECRRQHHRTAGKGVVVDPIGQHHPKIEEDCGVLHGWIPTIEEKEVEREEDWGEDEQDEQVEHALPPRCVVGEMVRAGTTKTRRMTMS